ncbi:expressed unknown protein [Seminavis robusta]|uniref:Uncharacterized protein n=1 Tax=Seminavis robusta TaxID=568900 RepID=A0A9N8HSY5_9STRA|nr:expressed unknown protein [Seminavis robusta]|eukprot:Sro1443_g273190.1 n/a (1999) ;mRNA; f:20825-26821
MVLEQNNSAMSEHNSQGVSSGTGSHPELASAHSKKMSLANKLKRQRKIRQSGAESPTPQEGGQSVGSKSPVRDNGIVYNKRAPTGNTGAAPNSTADNNTANAATQNKNAGGSSSMGSSLLHNKRRAMQLAKTRRGQPSNARPTAGASPLPASPVPPPAPPGPVQANNSPSRPAPAPSSAADGPAKTNMTDAGGYSPYRKMSASRVGLAEPAFNNSKATPANQPPQPQQHQPQRPQQHQLSSSNMPENHQESNAQLPESEPASLEESTDLAAYYDHDMSPVESVETAEYQQYNDSYKNTPTTSRAHVEVQPTPVPNQVQERTAPPQPRAPPILPPVDRQEYPARGRDQSRRATTPVEPSSFSRGVNHRSKTPPPRLPVPPVHHELPPSHRKAPFQDAPSMISHHEEIVPWEMEEQDVITKDSYDDPDMDDRRSQVSTGRSVISNGVVDYDESIMSLARLDNFRSKANQEKANKQTVYPGMSGGNGNINSQETQSSECASLTDVPTSAKAASKQWKSPGRDQRPSPARAASWKGRSVTANKTETTTSFGTKQNRGQSFGRQQPPWMKSPNAKAPELLVGASPTPSLASSAQPVSPARSAYSSASRFDRPSSPFLAVPKFNSSRSDVGVEHVSLPMKVRQPSVKSWKPTSAKKTTFAPNGSAPASSSHEEIRPGSPTPTWPVDQESCPNSPTQSATSSEADLASAGGVPKARKWSAKKQTPSWMKRAPSPTIPMQTQNLILPMSPKRGSDSAWKKASANESKDLQEPKPIATHASKAKHFSSTLPSIPKPSNATSKQVPGIEMDDRERFRQAVSPRRHSASPGHPSWVKPQTSESEGSEQPKPVTSPSFPTTKTWAVNKQTPAWMKKVKGNEEPAEKPPPPVPTTKVWSSKKHTPAWMKPDTESDAAPTPSPRRSSTPSWMKPMQPSMSGSPPVTAKDNVVSGSPQTPANRNKQGSEAVKSSETPPSPARNTANKTWRSTTPAVGEPRPNPSPRSQSWKPQQVPANVEKPPATRKIRHSIGGGEAPKLGPSGNIVISKRSPSPSVAQLQEQIFVTKLGVSGDSAEQRRGLKPKPQKGPTSPSPQVKQLQQIIFSPDKKKEMDLQAKSNAAGWWKRVPNAPEVQLEQCEAPTWKHEGSNASASEEQSDVSPSPTMSSDPAPKKGVWKKPTTLNHAAPSWLKDVAAFHENSPKAKLPSQPPVYQQPQQEQLPKPSTPTRPPTPTDARPKMPGSPMTRKPDDVPHLAHSPMNRKHVAVNERLSGSPMSHKLPDEGSADLMIVSSTSTTSRNDVVVQQEDTKSLIQMAADSVLIADYEQAMQRAVVTSKSEEEDESVGNNGINTLPNELPLEFQKALTEEETGVAKESEDSKDLVEVPQPTEHSSARAVTVTVTVNESAPVISNEQAHYEHESNEQAHYEHAPYEHAPYEHAHYEHAPLAKQEEAMLHPELTNNKPPAIEDTITVQADHQMEVEVQSHSIQVANPPTTTNVVDSKSKPNMADRAKALLGWTEKRKTPTKYEEMQGDPHFISNHGVAPIDHQNDGFQNDGFQNDGFQQGGARSPDASMVDRHHDMMMQPNFGAPAVVEKGNDKVNQQSFGTSTSVEHDRSMASQQNFGTPTRPENDFGMARFGTPTRTENHSMVSQTSFGTMRQDENGFPCVQDESGFPCAQDNDGFPCVQDENGFPCAPLTRNSVPATFGASDFQADAFGDQAWAAEATDEKKDSEELLNYWPPEMDPLNDTSEWGSRDPGLDSVPMASPEAVTAQSVIMTAEKMLQKFAHLDLDQATPTGASGHMQGVAADNGVSADNDAWVDRSRSSRSKENYQATQHAEADIWNLQALAAAGHHQHLVQKQYAQSPNRELGQHFSDEAAWRSPERGAPPASPAHEPVAMADPMWGTEQAVLDAAWGSPQADDPFSPANGHFDDTMGTKRPQGGDAFDPFGEEDDGFQNFATGKLFSEPPDEFVAVENFSPPTFSGNRNQSNAHANVFDTYYHPPNSSQKWAA